MNYAERRSNCRTRTTREHIPEENRLLSSGFLEVVLNLRPQIQNNLLEYIHLSGRDSKAQGCLLTRVPDKCSLSGFQVCYNYHISTFSSFKLPDMIRNFYIFA